MLVVFVMLLLAWGLRWFQGETAAPETLTTSQQDSRQATEEWLHHVRLTEADYVGSQRCAECHSEIAETYAQHPMALSVRSVREDPASLQPGIAEAHIPGTRTVLHTVSTDTQIIHSEQMYDEQGELIYEQEFPMDFVVGAGDRGRAYLRQAGQLLFMSPLNWYPQQDRWGLAPNFQPDDVRRFDRRALDSCLACHAGRPASAGRNSNTFQEIPFHEMAIGCERCHGPGREHIAYQEQSTPAGFDPILKLSALGSVERDSICYQCHLSATRILRPGRSHFDFQAGMKLSDVWCILDAGTDVDSSGKTRSVNHVQQMRSSRCYQQSSSAMSCYTCHDPHSVPKVVDKPSYYRQRCLQCHSGEDCNVPQDLRVSANDNCIHCHMPAAQSSNMSHVAQTDHRILRNPNPLADAPQDDSPQLEMFDHMREEIPPDEQSLDLALAAYSYLTQKGRTVPTPVAAQLRSLADKFPHDGRLSHALGTLAVQHRQQALAEKYFKQAAESGAEHEAVLQSLLELSYLQGNWSQAVATADELLRIDPADFRVLAMRGDAQGQMGDLQAGISSVERAVSLNPGELSYREWLIRAYTHLGKSKAANEQQAILKRLQSARIPDQLKE